MSAPQPPEAAVEAASAAIREADLYVDLSFEVIADIAVSAALPHLHRAWLEGLIAKAEECEKYLYRDEMGDVSAWLRAELEEGDGDGNA